MPSIDHKALVKALDLDRVQLALLEQPGIVFVSVGRPTSPVFKYLFVNANGGVSFAIGDERPFVNPRKLPFWTADEDWVGLVVDNDRPNWTSYSILSDFLAAAHARLQHDLCKFGWSPIDGQCMKESLLFHLRGAPQFHAQIRLLCRVLNQCLSTEYCTKLPPNLDSTLAPTDEYVRQSLDFWCSQDEKLCDFLQQGPHASTSTTNWDREALHQLWLLQEALDQTDELRVHTHLTQLLQKLGLRQTARTPRISRLFALLPALLVTGLVFMGGSAVPRRAITQPDFDQGQQPLSSSAPFSTGFGSMEFRQTTMQPLWSEPQVLARDDPLDPNRDVFAAGIYADRNPTQTSVKIVPNAFRVENPLPSCIRVLAHTDDAATRLVHRVAQRLVGSLPSLARKTFLARGLDIYLENNLYARGLAAEQQPVVRLDRALPAVELRTVALHEMSHTFLFELAANPLDFSPLVRMFLTESGSTGNALMDPRFLRFLNTIDNPDETVVAAAKASLRARVKHLHNERVRTNAYRGLYRDLYGMKNDDEFWAVSVENYMGTSLNVDYTGYPINHEWIKFHDPDLFEMLQDFFGPAAIFVQAFHQLG